MYRFSSRLHENPLNYYAEIMMLLEIAIQAYSIFPLAGLSWIAPFFLSCHPRDSLFHLADSSYHYSNMAILSLISAEAHAPATDQLLQFFLLYIMSTK